MAEGGGWQHIYVNILYPVPSCRKEFLLAMVKARKVIITKSFCLHLPLNPPLGVKSLRVALLKIAVFQIFDGEGWGRITENLRAHKKRLSASFSLHNSFRAANTQF